MNEKEIAELRRRFRPEKTSITHIRGCCVNENREIVSQFDQSLALLSQEESEKFLSLLRKTLSGGIGGSKRSVCPSCASRANRRSSSAAARSRS